MSDPLDWIPDPVDPRSESIYNAKNEIIYCAEQNINADQTIDRLSRHGWSYVLEDAAKAVLALPDSNYYHDNNGDTGFIARDPRHKELAGKIYMMCLESKKDAKNDS